MLIQPARQVTGKFNYAKQFAFFSLVTNDIQYQAMLESAQQKGFVGEDVEFFYFDNLNSNQFDGYSGLNYAIAQSQAEYLVFCHQDLIFHADGRTQLEQCLAELERIDPQWAVAGNAGRDSAAIAYTRISDPHGENTYIGNFPHAVMSLDENFLVINRKVNLASSYQMSGFHLYGTDLCQNAQNLGLKCYVLDFHLKHLSAGKLSSDYFAVKQHYMYVQQQRKQAQFYSTTCGNFFVSSSRWLTKLFNVKFFLKKIRSFRKHIK